MLSTPAALPQLPWNATGKGDAELLQNQAIPHGALAHIWGWRAEHDSGTGQGCG